MTTALSLLKVRFCQKVKYRGPILRVTSPALGSDDLSLDQSGTSIKILQEPNAVTCHVTSSSSGKIWIIVADWSRIKSSEPDTRDVTRKIGPLYFTFDNTSERQSQQSVWG